MLSKTPLGSRLPPVPKPVVEQSSHSQEPVEKEQERVNLPNFDPRNISKDSLYVTFSGLIEQGEVYEQEQLSVMFTLSAGEDWVLKNGSKSGISQVGSNYSNSNKKITWNLPFEVTYQTTVLTGWPQLVIQLHGRDFFGRNVIKAYGCTHLPSSQGTHSRQIQLFLPKPISLITGFFGYLNGCIAEYKNSEKILATGEDRQFTRVKSMGSVRIKVQTVKYNFGLFGYS